MGRCCGRVGKVLQDVITGSHAPARPRVAAPSLIGETMNEIRSSAQAAGVRVQSIRHRVCPHPGTPVGRVCEQTPSAGQVSRHATR
ncbi:PASTA domain-containing protein [Streptomyces sp. NPDC046197]|uniref:PASTA domain-containing protein n=1 Tax=Streptomyces sp. NPDC046197 TaxID=3154337 RepID=UPI0033FDCAD0